MGDASLHELVVSSTVVSIKSEGYPRSIHEGRARALPLDACFSDTRNEVAKLNVNQLDSSTPMKRLEPSPFRPLLLHSARRPLPLASFLPNI